MKILVIGHSHIKCILQSYRIDMEKIQTKFNFLQLHGYKKGHMPRHLNLSVQNVDVPGLTNAIIAEAKDVSAVFLLVTGNAPTVFGLRQWRQSEKEFATDGVSAKIKEELHNYISEFAKWMVFLRGIIHVPVYVLPPPPPFGSNELISNFPGPFKETLQLSGVSAPAYRLKIYELWTSGIKAAALKNKMTYVNLPEDIFENSQFLDEKYYGDEPSHANVDYGRRMLDYIPQIAATVAADGEKGTSVSEIKVLAVPGDNNVHPYSALPDASFWKQAVAQIPVAQFDPVGETPFKISRTEKVATAGSCFAQHISKRIRTAGFHFLVTEPPPNEDDSHTVRGFYDFSARYGNIYTARQLVQLFDRAFGYFSPLESHWELSGTRFCDPFRPRIEPEGFSSAESLIEDRRRHLDAVREMFLQLDVFVFTLGLTECWVSRMDGAAYPVAPGVAGGVFDPSKYEFVNFTVDEVVADLKSFIRKLRLVNPGAKLILTVSPVPLTATCEPRNVLVATTYSKSVLRVAADMVSRSHQRVYYFPSYEIITGNFNRGSYFGSDLRSITSEGVDHVMSVFMTRLTEDGAMAEAISPATIKEEADREVEEMMALAEAVCDEELLERE